MQCSGPGSVGSVSFWTGRSDVELEKDQVHIGRGVFCFYLCVGSGGYGGTAWAAVMWLRLWDLLKTIKTPNPKCRLYWCLIEFIDWRYSLSCWFFRPLL